MVRAYLGLGSNLGDRDANLRQALLEIDRQIGPVRACSAFYASEPWGFESPNSFLNACAAAETDKNPIDCLRILKGIEKAMGRTEKASGGYQDRIIDLDILLYDDLILDSETLQVPHPHLQNRLFVLVPLVEIAPDLVHPIAKKTLSELLEELSSRS